MSDLEIIVEEVTLVTTGTEFEGKEEEMLIAQVEGEIKNDFPIEDGVQASFFTLEPWLYRMSIVPNNIAELGLKFQKLISPDSDPDANIHEEEFVPIGGPKARAVTDIPENGRKVCKHAHCTVVKTNNEVCERERDWDRVREWEWEWERQGKGEGERDNNREGRREMYHCNYNKNEKNVS